MCICICIYTCISYVLSSWSTPASGGRGLGGGLLVCRIDRRWDFMSCVVLAFHIACRVLTALVYRFSSA